MEKIDLNNYEAYFLDFMEGNLGAEEKQDLFDFLALHPELKSEMEADFVGVELFPTNVEFGDKAALKIDESDLILSLNTVEELMIASIEGQLSQKHEGQLQAYIQKENLERKYAAYKATILVADQSIIYPEKSELKKETRVIHFSFYARVASVAAVGLFLIGFAINWNKFDPIDATASNGVNTGRKQISFAKSGAATIDIKEQSGTNLMADESSNPNLFEKEQEKTIDKNVMQPELQTPEQGSFVAQVEKPKIDSAKNDISPIKRMEFIELENNESQIAELPDNLDSLKIDKRIKQIEEEGDVLYALSNTIRKEEPFRIVTDAASNVVNRNIQFTRDKDVTANEYVAYSFKVGSFEFERKKSIKL